MIQIAASQAEIGKKVVIDPEAISGMMITVPAIGRSSNGPRPINLNRDIPQVVKLLESVFGESVHAGQSIFGVPGGNVQTAFLWRLNPAVSRLSPGFVWEQDGRIIGNVTLLLSQSTNRYLVANVAVAPEYRRRGIARQLMTYVIDLVQQRKGRVILLQVVKENKAAIGLYDSMGFENLGAMTSWYSSVARLNELPLLSPEENYQIRPLPSHRWREAYKLDSLVLPPDLNWPEPQAPDLYNRNLWRRVSDFLNGRQVESWRTTAADGRLTGLATIHSEWGRLHHLTVRIHPDWQGQLERPLLAKLIRRLYYLARRNVRIDHSDKDEVMAALLREANFYPRRTLTQMRLRL